MAKPGQKHIPQRTCVGCREVLPKRALIRVVRTAEGVRIDATSKLAGRGPTFTNSDHVGSVRCRAPGPRFVPSLRRKTGRNW
jgi:hypothetical protein